MHFSRLSTTALAAVALATSCAAHSWIEEMRIIAPNGTFTTDAPGYARGNVKRGPGVDPDKGMVHRLPPDGTAVDVGLQPKDPMCMPSQQKQTQTDGSPRLKAAPGDLVALRYQENGHVSFPNVPPGKAPNSGTVYIYGTTQPSGDEKFLDVFKQWNADGTGGNKKGKLLATMNYDDSQCYQINGGPISAARQKQFSHTADPLMGQDLWCQSDFAIPKDAPSGKPYTVYWVWDWSTLPNVDPGLPKGKAELYTTCMDVDITSSGPGAKSNVAVNYAQGQNLNQAAVASYISKLAAGNNMMASPSQSVVGSAAASAPAPASSATSQPGQQPQAASSPQTPSASAAAPPITVTKTVSVTVGTPQATSTTLTTVAKSTSQVSVPNAGAQGIPTISLKSFSGVASAVSASGNARMFRRVNGHIQARPSAVPA